MFMECYTSPITCKIIVAEGKEQVCEVIHILDKVNFVGALGIVDADFDRIEGRQNRGPNILMPEYHDLETMLFCSPALAKVLVEFGSKEKIEAVGNKVVELLVDTALPMGCLRLHSLRHSLGLRFD